MKLPEKMAQLENRLATLFRQTLKNLGEVFYGMAAYDWVHEMQKARSQQERLFTLMVYGELLGVPILPPYYSLRLLPYMVPTFENWRRSMLRERDLTDLIG